MAVVSDAEDRLERTKVYITDHLEETEADRVHFLTPDAFFELLEKREAETRGGEQTVGDYKVRVEYETVGEEEKKTRSDTIWKTIIKGFRRLQEDDS